MGKREQGRRVGEMTNQEPTSMDLIKWKEEWGKNNDVGGTDLDLARHFYRMGLKEGLNAPSARMLLMSELPLKEAQKKIADFETKHSVLMQLIVSKEKKIADLERQLAEARKWEDCPCGCIKEKGKPCEYQAAEKQQKGKEE